MHKFCVVTNGDLKLGCKKDEVRHKLTHLCNYDSETLDKIFSGVPFTFKTELDRVTATRYKSALDATGVDCRIEEVMSTAKIQIHPPGIDAVTHHPRSKDDLMMACPKCGENQPKRLSCNSCGIVVEKYVRQQQALAHEIPVEIDQSTGDDTSGFWPKLLLRLTVLSLLVIAGYFCYTSLFAESREIVVYTINDCEPCDAAINYLKREGLTCTIYNVDDSKEIANQFMKLKQGRVTLPLAFIGDVRIDGYNPARYQVAVAKYKGTLVSNNDAKVVMYSTERCGYCVRAESFFHKHDIPFTKYDIDVSSYMSEYRNLGGRGTPLIFVGGVVRIDGFDETALTMALEEAGLM